MAELAKAFHGYQQHLLELLKRSTFKSVLHYHPSLHSKRCRFDIYDPAAWDTPELTFYNLLQNNQRALNDQFAGDYDPAKRQKTSTSGSGSGSGASINTPKNPCNNFNAGECSSSNCRYAHVCAYCHRTSHVVGECKTKEKVTQGGQGLKIKGGATAAARTAEATDKA
jgi:hypothetical protein